MVGLLDDLGPQTRETANYSLWNLAELIDYSDIRTSWYCRTDKDEYLSPPKRRKSPTASPYICDLRHLDATNFVGMQAPFLFRSSTDLVTIFPEGADFGGGNLAGANFRGAILKKASFRVCNLKGVDFTNADVSGADFRNADISDAIFDGSSKEGALFNR